MNLTLLFILPTLALVLVHGVLLACVIKRLIAAYMGNEKDGAGKLEIGTMDILPMLLSLVFILSTLFSYLVLASLQSLWSLGVFLLLLTALAAYGGLKIVAILKKLK